MLKSTTAYVAIGLTNPTKWCLLLYPNGTQKDREGFASFYLYRYLYTAHRKVITLQFQCLDIIYCWTLYISKLAMLTNKKHININISQVNAGLACIFMFLLDGGVTAVLPSFIVQHFLMNFSENMF